MKLHAQNSDRKIIGEQAARWLVELAEGDCGQRAAFVAWIKESPRHVEEFLFATATLKELRGDVQQDANDEIERLIAEALAGSEVSNVIALKDAAIRTRPLLADSQSLRHGTGWRRTAVLAAAVVVVAFCFIALPQLLFFNAHTYATSLGEQRAVRLSDGSVVHLNAQSRLEVDYSAATRDVRLAKGEAIFKVERDPTRPFRVHAGNAVIQAVGTQFNVYRKPESTTVSVLEGKVRLLTGSGAAAAALAAVPDGATTQYAADEDGSGKRSAEAARTLPADDPAVSLIAGEQARIDSGGTIERRGDTDVAQVVAWRERRLMFRADRLEHIAAEFSRYSPRHIRLLDNRARDKRITGTFDADDPESLVLFLEKLNELAVVRDGDDFIIRSRY